MSGLSFLLHQVMLLSTRPIAPWNFLGLCCSDHIAESLPWVNPTLKGKAWADGWPRFSLTLSLRCSLADSYLFRTLLNEQVDWCSSHRPAPLLERGLVYSFPLVRANTVEAYNQYRLSGAKRTFCITKSSRLNLTWYIIYLIRHRLYSGCHK